jgi:hypothetical protein
MIQCCKILLKSERHHICLKITAAFVNFSIFILNVKNHFPPLDGKKSNEQLKRIVISGLYYKNILTIVCDDHK